MLVNLREMKSVLGDAMADIIAIWMMGCCESEATHDLDDIRITFWTL